MEVELVIDHCAVGERLGVISAGDADRVRHHGNARRHNDQE
jgi:hypothetical protein